MPASDVASEIVGGSLAGVAVFDSSGRLAYSNDAFQQSSLLLALVDPAGYLADGSLEQVRRAVVQRGSAARPRAAVTSSGGQPLDVELIPLRAAPEWTALVVRPRGLGQDQSADQLTLSILVHELKGSLLLANESLEALIQIAESGPTELRAAVTRQARSVARLSALVQGLGDLSSAREMVRTRQPRTRVDLGRLVEEIGASYQELAAANGQQLDLQVDLAVPRIEGEPALLGRAIANLVDNALKYGSSARPVRLGLRRRGALAVVEVEDSGPGIDPEDQAKIFTEFVRLPGARAGQTPGSGLGLAVARRVAEAHGGRLSLESHPGVGSVFRLSFLLGREAVGSEDEAGGPHLGETSR
ncbi:MAG: HAMP domain-containing sensor histidine kinase [Candidatus Dormibacteria bacterium]